MTIAGIDPKCYILALFVRDDGVRFLLGDDPYEFKDKQLHFQPNTVANDVVEVQGNDGYLLAGQVRRPGTQSFDGYVCNGTNSKAEVEVKRREFLQFFRRSHFYKVIYVFPNGTAIQRKQGFLVDEPTVQELYQQYPEYHVALNFEDVNYYTYEEDDQGHEIYAKEAIVPLAGGGATGGLIWDEYGVVWEDPWSDLVSVSGSEIQIDNEAGARASIQDLELQGDTEQNGTPTPDAPIPVQTVTGEQTITVTGKNLIDLVPMTNMQASLSSQCTIETVLDPTLGRNVVHITGTNNFPVVAYNLPNRLQSGKYYALKFTYRSSMNSATKPDLWFSPNWSTNIWDVTSPITQGRAKSGDGDTITGVDQSTIWKTTSRRFYVVPEHYESVAVSYSMVCFSLGYNSDSSGLGGKEVWLADAQIYEITEEEWNENDYTSIAYEPYQYQSYPISLGSNLVSINDFVMGGLSKGSLVTAAYRITNANSPLEVNPNTTYTISAQLGSGVQGFRVGVHQLNASKGFISDSNWQQLASGAYTFTTSANTRYIAIVCSLSTTSTTVNTGSTENIEAFTSPSAWLRGCTIWVEKGNTIRHFSSIELCKIGDYQDYIYKSGEDWYIHKEVRHLSKAIADMDNSENFPGWKNVSELTQDSPSATNANMNLYTDSWDNITGVNMKGSGRLIWGANNNSNELFANRNFFGSTWTQTYWKTNYPDLVVELYYGILNPVTDTQITDATLVGQLNALGAMKLFIGENNLLVSATGTNLPATLEFSYPTKFAAIGAEWEEGGTKGATIVDVNAIDNTYPVWELIGPAVNPTLSVLTTNTTLTYNGTITASQKLVIDMFNKTATLNGTSVIGNVSGDFVYMAPGTNRIAYTAGNTDAPDSTIYWQEVVG